MQKNSGRMIAIYLDPQGKYCFYYLEYDGSKVMVCVTCFAPMSSLNWDLDSCDVSNFNMKPIEFSTHIFWGLPWITKNFRYLKWRNPEHYFRLFWGWVFPYISFGDWRPSKQWRKWSVFRPWGRLVMTSWVCPSLEHNLNHSPKMMLQIKLKLVPEDIGSKSCLVIYKDSFFAKPSFRCFVLPLLSVKVECGRRSKMGKQRRDRTNQEPRIGDL